MSDENKAPVVQAVPEGWRERLQEMREASYTISQYPETAEAVFDSVIDALDSLAAAPAPAQQPDLLAEALAVFDLMLDGCNDKEFGDFQNGHGETIGPRMDALHAKLRAAVSGAAVPAVAAAQEPVQPTDDNLFWSDRPKALLKREDWDPVTRKPKVAAPAEAKPVAPTAWHEAARIANLPTVDEALQGFSDDPTAENGICVIRAVLESFAAPVAPTADLAVELQGVADELDEQSGFWRSCSGCYETEDGHPVGRYPYSHVFGCALGGGCSECGGIGAVWDNTDYEAMGRDLMREEAEAVAHVAEGMTEQEQAVHDAIRRMMMENEYNGAFTSLSAAIGQVAQRWDEYRAALAARPAAPSDPYALDDDDVARFPNDTDVVIVHKDYYWKLRGCEDICAALDAQPSAAVPTVDTPSALTSYNSIVGERCYRAVDVDAHLARHSQPVSRDDVLEEVAKAMTHRGWTDSASVIRALKSAPVAAPSAPTQQDEQQIQWSHELQERLIAASQDISETAEARDVMAEAACLLAAMTGRPAVPAAPEQQEGN